MLLKSLRVQNSRGSLLDLPLAESGNGFKIKSIEGLDPVTATIASGTFGQLDGEQYFASRRQKRNIVISLKLNPDYAFGDVETLRKSLSGFFMPGSQIKMSFTMFDRFSSSIVGQNKTLTIMGRVESFQSPLFTNDPTADISILCFDPDFQDPNQVVLNGYSSNDSVKTTYTYDGTVKTGVLLTVSPLRTLSQFTIYHIPPDGTLRSITFQYPMVSGDIVTISSVPGNKYAKHNQAGFEKTVLYGLITPGAGWVTLEPGDNQFQLYATGAPVPYSLSYINRYGGL